MKATTDGDALLMALAAMTKLDGERLRLVALVADALADPKTPLAVTAFLVETLRDATAAGLGKES